MYASKVAFPTVSVGGGIGPTHWSLSCVIHCCISYCICWWWYWSNPLLSCLCQPFLHPSDSCMLRKLHFLLCPLVVVLVQPTAFFPVSSIAANPTVSVGGGIDPTHCFLSCVSHSCIHLIHVCFESCISYCVHWWGYWSNPLLSFLFQALLHALLKFERHIRA